MSNSLHLSIARMCILSFLIPGLTREHFKVGFGLSGCPQISPDQTKLSRNRKFLIVQGNFGKFIDERRNHVF